MEQLKLGKPDLESHSLPQTEDKLAIFCHMGNVNLITKLPVCKILPSCQALAIMLVSV